MKVSRRSLRALRGGAANGFSSRLRALGSVALTLALLATLAPLGSAARAQAPSKGQSAQIEEGYHYVIEQTADGDTTCRLVPPGEIEIDRQTQLPVRQINHLMGAKDSAAASGAGLTIILRATTRLDANPTARQAFINAAAKWEAYVSTPITITIDVDYGPDFFGDTTRPYGERTLGQTGQATYVVPYTTVRQRLINRAAAGSPEAVLLSNLPASSLPTDLGNVDSVSVPRSMMNALGINFNEADDTVPKIGFNTKFNFDFDHTNGFDIDPATGNFYTDFDSVAVHEIGHALGFNSRVGGTELSPPLALRASVWDFYRFRPGAGTAGTFSSAPRVLSSGTSPTDPHAHFSGGAELRLSTGRPDGTSGDGQQSSHWKDDRFGPFIGIMDPTIPGGRHEELTANDVAAIDFFGYSVVGGPPPPPPPPGPPNDHFANAQTLPGSSGTVGGTNVNATSESGEPNHSPANDAGGKSVWYNWTAPSNGSVEFTTAGSSYDTVLAAYTGASVSSLANGVKNDDVQDGVVRTSRITFNVTAGTIYRVAVDGWEGEAGGITLNYIHTPAGGNGQPSFVGFTTHAFTASETAGAALITLGRSNPAAAARIGVRTIDDPAAVPCSNTAGTVAFARCDYATTIDIITFAPGESAKTVAVPLINDAYGEPDETVDIEIFNVDSSLQFGVVPRTRLTITSDEPPGQGGAANPVGGVPFFVRMHYLDFLSREPEQGEPWSNVLNGCADQFNQSATSPSAGCDRITVSAAFFGSPEFALKGGYAFRFYKVAFGRLPEYAEIVVDMRQLTGATSEEVIARRAAYPVAFVQRADFLAAFSTMSNEQFVNTLMNRYGQNLLMITSRDPSDPENGQKIGLSRTGMTAALNNGQWSRAQVLRAIADSDEVSAAEFRPAFVAMQYYGYLRRTPEITGYNAWLNYLNANPNDSRTMVNGFLNSTEYRLRFGQP